MTDNAVRGIARLRAKIGATTDHEAAEGIDVVEGISDVDRALLRELSNEIRLLGEAKYSHQRHEFYLRRCFVIARDCGDLAAAVEDKAVAKRVVAWIVPDLQRVRDAEEAMLDE